MVLGISPDSQKSHAKFKRKRQLTYPLLVDEEHRVAELYGTWQEKLFWGRKYWGVVRSTFIVAPDGTVAKAMRKVDAEGHAAEVAGALEQLKG
ncbi:MAG: bcp [Gemmatimonadetes bacterium]|nr:bcp [Gemmatimonadota bacterium]